MGDRLDIVTGPTKTMSPFYNISSGAISFEVKGYGPALIGLSKLPGVDVPYWIGFGESGRCFIKVPDPTNATFINDKRVTQDFHYNLSEESFKKFWVMWDSQSVQVGEEQNLNNVIMSTSVRTDLRYVIFYSEQTCNWRVEMPPAAVIKISRPLPMKPLNDGKPCWHDADGQLPDEAMIGGFENGEALYIIRARHRGSLTPGKFVPSEATGYISWGGEAHAKSEFEVLCGYDCEWKATEDDQIPLDAFLAGQSEDGTKLFIGRVHYKNQLIIGKAQPSHKVCYFPYQEKELPSKEYEILTVPHSNVYVANESYANEVWGPSEPFHFAE